MRIVLLGDSHLARVRRDLPLLGEGVVNAAVGGATVLDLDGQASAVRLGPDDVAVVSVGTNDAAPWRRMADGDFRSALDGFLASHGVRRWVVVLPPGVVEARLGGAGDRTNATIDDCRAAVTAAAAAVGAVVVDPRAVLAELGESAFAGDGLHLSGEGYRGLLPALRSVLAPMEGDEWEPPPAGSLIRLMGDYGADMPLWEEEGLLLADADEGVRLLGLTQELALALQNWGTAWDGRDDQVQRDAEAELLLTRLRVELGDRYEFRYHP